MKDTIKHLSIVSVTGNSTQRLATKIIMIIKIISTILIMVKK